ncbi:winged helix-turn-helix domain-containing protein [Streptomyces rubellomurinus]|uniref:winged helix-turn-helix domain-containing protein n=1 Tax=Streptomyces rubellomurinus (strain ATCC 31215) TaxID=359131 RepID=UPI0005F196C8|nr:helix-turn-helix domain-containing protein [Streptomyces rubellomurinus]
MTEDQGWKHSDDPHVVLTAKGMKAMAHPVRMQLVGLLRKHGPSTATRLAEQLGLNSGATSYHLRQLAAAGFVEEDAERGNARERWWRSVRMMTVWTGDDLADEETETAVGFLRSVLAAHTLTGQRTLDAFETMPREWRKAVDFNDLVLRLTPAEAEQLGAELSAVIKRYRREGAEGPVPAGAEQVSVIVHVFPDPAVGDADDAADADPTTDTDADTEGDR